MKDLKDIQKEVGNELEEGRKNGELEVEVMSRMIWQERQRNEALCRALEEILKVATAALERERSKLVKTADVLEWKTPH